MASTAPQAALAIRNILIATDFSSCSDRALLHAVAAANRLGSMLHLLHVVQPQAFYVAAPDGYMGGPEIEIQAVTLAERDANTELKRTLHSLHCDSLNRHVWVKSGSVKDMLLEVVAREHIDFVVVGTHGRTGIRKLALGSVAEEIFRNAPCPVLTVGPHSWTSDPHALRLRHILFPTDLSQGSAAALPLTLATAAEFRATVTMLNVVETFDREAADDRTRASAIERNMRSMVCEAGGNPDGIDYQIRFGDVAETVINSASRGTDLIMFGLKPPTTYADRVPWMKAYKIACAAPCPVLSLRSKDRR